MSRHLVNTQTADFRRAAQGFSNRRLAPRGSWFRAAAIRRSARGFTLVELLVTMAIIGMMSSIVLVAMYNAQETARVEKTKSTIAKLNNIIAQKYESYRNRRLPIFVAFDPTNPNDPKTQPTAIAKYRVDALRDLMRLELPERWQDLIDAPITLQYPAVSGSAVITRPAANQSFLRAYNSIQSAKGMSFPNNTFQNAECLYLIVTSIATDDGGGRELFHESEIGDTDNDGAFEFLDGWKQPIRFLRWAPGFTSELQNIDATAYHDQFDPQRVYPTAYALYPLIYSSGPDKVYGVKSSNTVMGQEFQYSTNNNNPFSSEAITFGTQMDFNTEPNFVANGWTDNIHNHLLGAK